MQAAQKYITGLDARRISKQPEARYVTWQLAATLMLIHLDRCVHNLSSPVDVYPD